MFFSQNYIKLALRGVPLLFLWYSGNGKLNLYQFYILKIKSAFKCVQCPMQITVFFLHALFHTDLRRVKIGILAFVY